MKVLLCNSCWLCLIDKVSDYNTPKYCEHHSLPSYKKSMTLLMAFYNFCGSLNCTLYFMMTLASARMIFGS